MDFNAVGWRLMDTEWRSLVGKIVDLPPLLPDALLRESERDRNCSKICRLSSVLGCANTAYILVK